jgi:hypothetical protein
MLVEKEFRQTGRLPKLDEIGMYRACLFYERCSWCKSGKAFSEPNRDDVCYFIALLEEVRAHVVKAPPDKWVRRQAREIFHSWRSSGRGECTRRSPQAGESVRRRAAEAGSAAGGRPMRRGGAVVSSSQQRGRS